jgi:hypothetical protein
MSRMDRLPIGAAFEEPRAQMAVSRVGTTSHRDLPKPTGLADGLEVGSPRPPSPRAFVRNRHGSVRRRDLPLALVRRLGPPRGRKAA